RHSKWSVTSSTKKNSNSGDASTVWFVLHIVDRSRARTRRDLVHTDAWRGFRGADRRRMDGLAEEWIVRYRSLCPGHDCTDGRIAYRDGRRHRFLRAYRQFR